MRAILQRGDSDARTCTGANEMPLLHLAIHAGHVHLLPDILEFGADINMRDREFGTTPLLMAIINENVVAARHLLKVRLISQFTYVYYLGRFTRLRIQSMCCFL